MKQIVEQWDRSSPAYREVVDNTRLTDLILKAGGYHKLIGFREAQSRWDYEQSKKPDLTYPEYIWQRFGKR